MVSLAFYGMSTFEGPMMAIKTVNALSHYTDWTIGHVHALANAQQHLATTNALVDDTVVSSHLDRSGRARG